MSDRPAERTPASRNLWAFGATSFLNDTATEMAYWILPAFLLSIGAGPAKLGLIEGISESVASFAKLFSGYFTDRVQRRKPLVVAGYTIANAVKPVLAVTTSWWQVLLIRFSDRLAKGIRGAPRDVMLAESVPKNKLGSAFGLLQAMDSAGAIAGPLIALAVVAHYGFRGVFWTAALPGALAIAVAMIAIKETRRSGGAALERDEEISVNGSDLRMPASFYYLLVATALFSVGNSSDMFLVLRAQNLGMKAGHAPLFGLVFNITYTLTSWPAGKLADRMSKRVLAAAGYLVFAAVYFVFAAPPSLMALWITMSCYGLFYSLTNPVLRALVVETTAADARGRALGIYFFVTSVAILLSSIITGELWKSYGPRVPFYLSAALAVVAAAMLLVAPGQHPKGSESR
jgi:MFS family permease